MAKKRNDLTLISIMEQFSTEEEARAYFEGIRWPDGRACPHCGNNDQTRIYERTATKGVRPGLYKCAECKGTFTVRVGTVMEDSHIPLRKWLIAFYMICASKTQVSALQLQRQLELGSYRSALFLCHRIRFALADFLPSEPLDGTVEADETYIGGRVKGRGRGYVKNKTPIVSLVERGGRARSRVVDRVNGATVGKLLRQHVAPTATLNTDESSIYDVPGRGFSAHDTVNHGADEYSRVVNGRKATTNTVEGYFGNSKRSIDGTHHHISRRHAGLYFSELDHKYNTRHMSDGERTVAGIRGIEGKRLMLRPGRTA